MNQITLTINLDVTPEHAVAMLEDLSSHVMRYNPRVIQGVSASTGGHYLDKFHGLKEREAIGTPSSGQD
jgi:hypothetical protein